VAGAAPVFSFTLEQTAQNDVDATKFSQQHHIIPPQSFIARRYSYTHSHILSLNLHISMADPSTAKVSYETVAIDSGYLSDLVEAVQRNNDDATAWFASSSNSGDAYATPTHVLPHDTNSSTATSQLARSRTQHGMSQREQKRKQRPSRGTVEISPRK